MGQKGGRKKIPFGRMSCAETRAVATCRKGLKTVAATLGIWPSSKLWMPVVKACPEDTKVVDCQCMSPSGFGNCETHHPTMENNGCKLLNGKNVQVTATCKKQEAEAKPQAPTTTTQPIAKGPCKDELGQMDCRKLVFKDTAVGSVKGTICESLRHIREDFCQKTCGFC